MLILEGSDCVGKTTVAKRIVELTRDMKYPIRYQHMTRQHECFDFFNHYRDMLSLYAVQDRFHLGALVWHEGVMTPAQLRIIEGWIASLGSYTVVFIANGNWYKEHLTHHSPHMFESSVMIQANTKYACLTSKLAGTTPIFDETIYVPDDWPLSDERLLGIIGRWFERIDYAIR